MFFHQNFAQISIFLLPKISFCFRLEIERDVLGAYVTFDNKADCQRCLHAYRWSQVQLGQIFQTEEHRFHGKRIKVAEADEPSNILWENADCSRMESWSRCCGVTFVVALLLLFSVGIFSATDMVQDHFQQTVTGDCDK